MAGSSAINIILQIIRTKFLAILLGPSGIGFLGLLNSTRDVMVTTASLGIDSSGVRQIAEAASGQHENKIARTVHILRRSVFHLAAFGMILTVVLSSPISQLTFQNTDHTFDIILLSIVILFGTLTNGELALILGMRRIGDLAKINILSGLLGTILGIPIVYLWGQKGIVPFLIGISGMSLLTTWFYARQVTVSRVQMRWAEIRAELKPLLKLGAAIMVSLLITKGTMYLVNVLVVRHLSLEAVGLYQAAVILSSTYAGFILSSMVKDYLPRLTGIANDHVACNKLVNEQIEVGILLSVPGILATLTFAPLMIRVFYTTAFVPAFEILRWQILGIFLQVISWPIFFILEAKGRGKLYLLTTCVTSVVHLGLIWVGISTFGLQGTGMAFLGMWLIFGIMIYNVAKRLTGFTWSGANIRIALVTLPAVGIVFLSGLVLDQFWSMILGSTISIAMAFYAMKSLGGIAGLRACLSMPFPVNTKVPGVPPRELS